MSEATGAKKSSAKTKKSFDIEKALARLDEINTELSKSGTSLKDSLALYKEGVELAEKCKENLEGVEKEIQILSEE
ncbi:MAG: exodeoxyribonuclease VII small subunit [Eubacterium sp.]|nr:exodeoxyribonuclease VII small subunit [Eubacterium sp.]